MDFQHLSAKHVIWGIVCLVFVIPGLCFFFSSRGPLATPLIVHLRCEGTPTGRLSFEIREKDPHPRKVKDVDVAQVCRAPNVIVDGYHREESVRVLFQHASGVVTEVLSEYGSDIQSDPDGSFHLILKIKSTPPYLANDRI